MPKEGDELDRERVRTRLHSSRQDKEKTERRNSVSEITEFFQSVANSPNNMSTRKTSGRIKDKEKEKELREVKANIRNYIINDEPLKSNDNANGVNAQLNHDNIQGHATSNDETEQLNAPNASTSVQGTKDNATQTNDDEILKAIKELALKCNKLENSVEDPKLGLEAQLAKTQKTVAELYTDINGAVSGLKVQMEKLVATASENTVKLAAMQDSQKRMSALLDKNKRLVSELRVMQGLIQKVSQQSNHNSTQLLDVMQRGMEQNLVLYGVDNRIEIEDPKLETPMFTANERVKHSAMKFFKDELNVDVEIEDIWKAHRMGPFKVDKMRPLIVKVSYSAKELIMENMSKLKGKSNPVTQQKYFISEQVPDGISEVKKQTQARVKVLRDTNDAKPHHEKSKIQVIRDKILVNGELDIPEITTPLPSQLFLSAEEQSKVEEIQSQMVQTEPETYRNSEFMALAVRVSSVEDVRRSYIAVVQRHPSADHHMLGYALKEEQKLRTGFCDDREFGAAIKIKRAIFELKSRNTAVFVLRKYGGVHLGFDRFRIIEEIAKKAVRMLNEF